LGAELRLVLKASHEPRQRSGRNRSESSVLNKDGRIPALDQPDGISISDSNIARYAEIDIDEIHVKTDFAAGANVLW
jgi:hypothetical protein